MIRRRELPPQELAQGQRGLNRHHFPAMLEKLERQPSRSRADLGDPVYAMRQPAQHIRMEPLDAGQPVIELRFEPIQQLPGQDHVSLRIAVPMGDEPARLVAGEHAKVGGGVAPAQFLTRPGRNLRPDHRPQPSSYRSPRRGRTAAAPREAPAGAAPRRSPPGSQWSGCARKATARRYSGCGDPHLG